MKNQLAGILHCKSSGNPVGSGCCNQVVNAIEINGWKLVKYKAALLVAFFVNQPNQCRDIKRNNGPVNLCFLRVVSHTDYFRLPWIINIKSKIIPGKGII